MAAGRPGQAGEPVLWPVGVVSRQGHATALARPHSTEGRTVQTSPLRHKRATLTTVRVSLFCWRPLFSKQCTILDQTLVFFHNYKNYLIIIIFSVDGAWATWTSWGTCTVTCGGGTQTRSRTCTNPAPQYGGANCPGSAGSSQACNTQHCPSTSRILFEGMFYVL